MIGAETVEVGCTGSVKTAVAVDTGSAVGVDRVGIGVGVVVGLEGIG